MSNANQDAALNRDPLTGEPGSHPVGTGVGAAGGGAAGVVVGAAVGGPVGAVVGGAVGAVAGAAAGHGAAEALDPTLEDAYWNKTYKTRDYVDRTLPYTEYAPAYRYGWEARNRYGAKPWNEIETDLERGWQHAKGSSSLAWNHAKHATRDAWHRVEDILPGDADRDGH
ncbi:MAG TPA: hypothetical protein VN783_09555 [Thermoanaerobaculia bacterium]|nr:hypothetical protein [Thermoanaerobaculia bacterium]